MEGGTQRVDRRTVGRGAEERACVLHGEGVFGGGQVPPQAVLERGTRLGGTHDSVEALGRVVQRCGGSPAQKARWGESVGQ